MCQTAGPRGRNGDHQRPKPVARQCRSRRNRWPLPPSRHFGPAVGPLAGRAGRRGRHPGEQRRELPRGHDRGSGRGGVRKHRRHEPARHLLPDGRPRQGNADAWARRRRQRHLDGGVEGRIRCIGVLRVQGGGGVTHPNLGRGVRAPRRARQLRRPGTHRHRGRRRRMGRHQRRIGSRPAPRPHRTPRRDRTGGALPRLTEGEASPERRCTPTAAAPPSDRPPDLLCPTNDREEHACPRGTTPTGRAR